jgi:hypothetical protein
MSRIRPLGKHIHAEINGWHRGKVAFVFDRSSIPHHPSISWIFGRDWLAADTWVRFHRYHIFISVRLVCCARRIWALYDSPSCRLVYGSPLTMRRFVCMYRQGIISDSVIRHWYESVPREFQRSLGLSHRSQIVNSVEGCSWSVLLLIDVDLLILISDSMVHREDTCYLLTSRAASREKVFVIPSGPGC